MTTINYEETKRAWTHWFDYHREVANSFRPSVIDYWDGFTKFLGCEPFADPTTVGSLTDESTYLVTEQTYHKLQMLLGPHSYTIIKAWYAKEGRCP